MMAKLSENALLTAANWAYEKATTCSLPGIGSAQELATQYMQGSDNLEKQVDSLIRWQCSKTTFSGFITSLGGIVTLPIAIPADLSISFFHQMRMVSAISYMSGVREFSNDKLQTICIGCLCGSVAVDIFRDLGIEVEKKMAMQMIKSISGETIKQINKAVGFRLVTKFGSTGVINLGKAVPLFGGAVGGAFNYFTTSAVGKTAKKIFIPEKTN